MAIQGNRIVIVVPDVTQVLDVYTHLRLYRRLGRSGTAELLRAADLPIPLVSTQTTYEYVDPSGTAEHWYQYAYYNATTGAESELSEPQPGQQTATYTRTTLVRMLAMLLGAYGLPEGDYRSGGPSGTTTAAGDASGGTVVCAAFQSNRLPEDAYRDWYLRLASGPLAGAERPVASLAPATGTFTLARPFGSQVGSGVDIELYAYRPFAWWADCLFGEHVGAVQDVWVPFVWAIAGPPPPPPTGSAPDSTYRHLPLPGWIERAVQILRVRWRLSGSPRTALLSLGPDYEVHEGPSGVELYLPAGLGHNQVVILEGYRQCPRLVDDMEAIHLTPSQLRLLLVTGAVQALRQLASPLTGLSEDVRRWQMLLAQYEAERRVRTAEVGNWRMQAGLRPDLFLSLGPEVV